VARSAAAVSFEILNLRTGNTLAAFDDEDTATQALADMAERNPGRARYLALVFFDRDGLAVSSKLQLEYDTVPA
jgi:predicted ATP-grasp superfamily ATP-dependent carboligase